MLCRSIFCFLVAAAAIAASETKPVSAAATHPLVWDAMEKTFNAKPGGEVAEFEFAVRNTSENPVEITALQPSCGCTVADMPQTPWIIPPGERSSFRSTVDFAGKEGTLTKTIHVVSIAGTQRLTVKVNIPDTEESRRARNQRLATADRQAVFRNDCAACHVTPTIGKTGGELFKAACGICHSSEHRASMVPDLAVAREPRDAAYWRTWISNGRERTLMPAFSRAHGGPLTAEQIESLVAHALKTLPTQPPAK